MQLLKREAELDRKILIVDDEFIEREMLGAMLSDLYQVSTITGMRLSSLSERMTFSSS